MRPEYQFDYTRARPNRFMPDPPIDIETYLREHGDDIVARTARVNHLLEVWKGATPEQIVEDLFWAIQYLTFKMHQAKSEGLKK